MSNVTLDASLAAPTESSKDSVPRLFLHYISPCIVSRKQSLRLPRLHDIVIDRDLAFNSL